MSAFDDPRRLQSDELAARAEAAWRTGDVRVSRELFAEAAALEEAVASEAATPRIRSLLAVSATALWYKAADYARAKRCAYGFLADDRTTEQGRIELERLVDRCSREGELAKFDLDKSMVPVEVKLEGGRVGTGLAPASVTRSRRERVVALLMRSADLEAGREYRERGESDLAASNEVQVFEVPALAASYGLRFYVASPAQQSLGEDQVKPAKVVQRFLAIADAAQHGPDEVRRLVGDELYARAFISGFGELAPDGKDVAAVACSAPTWKVSAARTVFEPRHRAPLRTAAEARPLRSLRPGEEAIVGTLESVHASSSEKWIEIKTERRAEAVIVMVDKANLLRALVAETDSSIRAFTLPPKPPKHRRHQLVDFEILGATDR